MEHTSMCAWLQASHSIARIMEPQQHFNHLSDVKNKVDNYHSVPHGTLASLLAQGLKELSFPENRNQDGEKNSDITIPSDLLFSDVCKDERTSTAINFRTLLAYSLGSSFSCSEG
jgi:hypothetical protein